MIAFHTYREEQFVIVVYVVSGLIALLASFFTAKRVMAIARAAGRWQPTYNRIPVDIRMAFILLAGLGTIAILTYATDQLPYMDDSPVEYGWSLLYGLTLAAICFLMTMIQLSWLAPRIKDGQAVGQEWNQALLSRAWRGLKSLSVRAGGSIREAFLNKSTGTQLFLALFLVFALGFATLMMVLHPGFILLYAALLVAFGLPLVAILTKRVGYFNRITLAAHALAAGNTGQELQVPGTSALAQLARNINVLKQGVRTLQNEQAKSERLKTELITNVSHDLRTPLTSIITYVGLLKKEEVSDENRAAYIEIIEKKSMRLKVLIDDLFEVSKMVSGNVELAREKIDLVQLLQQALAEYNSDINDSNLQFRVSAQEEPIFAQVDGQKLWRVFDNLIENILKYSLEGTRVYISIHASDQKATITFKNVSKYELNGNLDELLERFKRGDSSRHAEGSGLGLAIAKSIVDLHEGHLIIDMDGDLFKACLSLNL
jgi:signal transduction histidine kinase